METAFNCFWFGVVDFVELQKNNYFKCTGLVNDDDIYPPKNSLTRRGRPR